MYSYGLRTHKLYSRNLPEAYNYENVYTSLVLIWRADVIGLIPRQSLSVESDNLT